jgi:BASS family bile acid:Na+ symporter
MFAQYPHYEYGLAATQLILASLGMGATTSWSDFRNILRQPLGVAFAVACQYLLFPALVVLLTLALPLPIGIAVGLLLVVSLPSGSLTNIYTHLGRGNVPLSITATVASTLVCLVMTPTILRLFASSYLPPTFQMPAGRIIAEITCFMLLPLAAGMLIGKFYPQIVDPFSRWTIRASLVALVCIIVGSLGSGRLDVWAYGWTIPALIIVFGILKMAIARLAARLCSLSLKDAFTLTIEIGIRNCNLGILLVASLFPAEATELASVGSGVLYVTLFYGGAALVVGLFPVAEHRWRVSRAEAH